MSNKNNKPWETEPDHLAGTFSGINYNIKRAHLELGFLCGYITIPKNNPLAKANHYDDNILNHIPTHGGLTYSNIEENGDLTIGFDCGHCGDLSPGLIKMLGKSYNERLHKNDIYRDIEYVKDICKQACWIIAGNTLDGEINKALYERYSKQ